MALRVPKRLTARAVQTISEPGRHADGDGLYLNVTATGARSWVTMWSKGGRRREMGLGSASVVTLAEAREAAQEARRAVFRGEDPIAARRASKAALSFAEAADAFIKAKVDGLPASSHRRQWTRALTELCRPIAKRPIADIDTDDVMRVLQPVWTKTPETATRLRQRVERMLDFAKVRGWRSGENPARWKGHLDHILPSRTAPVEHRAAMPWKDVPAFLTRLDKEESVSAFALEFLILTAARTGEVLGARWSEIDVSERLWTVPAKRMKGKQEHRVPLCAKALAILDLCRQGAEDLNDGHIFPGAKRGAGLSNMSLDMLLRRLDVDVTTHGFRSSFRDWCGDATDVPREIAEAALAHRIGNAVERAYRRGDGLQKRRQLMDQWEKFCGGA